MPGAASPPTTLSARRCASIKRGRPCELVMMINRPRSSSSIVAYRNQTCSCCRHGQQGPPARVGNAQRASSPCPCPLHAQTHQPAPASPTLVPHTATASAGAGPDVAPTGASERLVAPATQQQRALRWSACSAGAWPAATFGRSHPQLAAAGGSATPAAAAPPAPPPWMPLPCGPGQAEAGLPGHPGREDDAACIGRRHAPPPPPPRRPPTHMHHTIDILRFMLVTMQLRDNCRRGRGALLLKCQRRMPVPPRPLCTCNSAAMTCSSVIELRCHASPKSVHACVRPSSLQVAALALKGLLEASQLPGASFEVRSRTDGTRYRGALPNRT